jgi:hypothetical protein
MAAVVYKITYKNHCTPQEYITENSRWYLDSDVGARLTGTAVVNSAAVQPTYATGTLATSAIATLATSGKLFVYIKNTGTSGTNGDINISFADEDEDGSEPDGYRILLGIGECFASKIANYASINIKNASGSLTATYEYITTT